MVLAGTLGEQVGSCYFKANFAGFSHHFTEQVNVLFYFCQTLCAEIFIHEAHKDSISKKGEEMVETGHPSSDEIQARTEELQEQWDDLKKLSDQYKGQLDLSLQAKQVCQALCLSFSAEKALVSNVLARNSYKQNLNS